MKSFSPKLLETFPVIDQCHRMCTNGLVKQYIRLLNFRKNTWNTFHVPYIEEVVNYLQAKKGYLPKRILLVCEHEMIAMKAAAYIKDHYEEYQMNTDGYEYGWRERYDELDDAEEDRLNEWVRVIRMEHPIGHEGSGINKYASYLFDVGTEHVVFFYGLSNGRDIREKIEAVSACPACTQLIHIHPDQLQEPWVQELLIDYGGEMLTIHSPSSEYYEKVFAFLLKEESCYLSDALPTKLLVKKIIKRRGASFKEEDLAWYLNQALNHRREKNPDDNELKLEDFEILSLGEEKPLESLMKLSGLKHVKEIAKEMAALVREEVRNKHLKETHKNMLFVGNPGTGKTTCAKILADIMSEEGTSNAVFIKASRRDVIGEYVGRTAPMVAKVFEEARGGILFVDEAGFFLNQNSGGYVDEALKEFVRYMEMYPDVTVIFAMYPKEAKRFLELDAGLSSRISHIVEFDDYTIEELCEITESVLRKNGYTMKEDAKEIVRKYMGQMKKEKSDNFGNARESRKLAESAVIAVSMRHFQKKKGGTVITKDDMAAACERLIQKKRDEKGKGNDIFSCNLENRVIHLTGEVTDEMAASITAQLLYLASIGNEDIQLYINSPGGSVSAGMAIYDTMQYITPDIVTVCLGKAASMGAVILSGGTKGKRMILPHGEVMIHQPSGGMEGQASDLLVAADHIIRTKSMLNELISENCGRDRNLVFLDMERDHWMSAQEAVEYGVVDKILTRL